MEQDLHIALDQCEQHSVTRKHDTSLHLHCRMDLRPVRTYLHEEYDFQLVSKHSSLICFEQYGGLFSISNSRMSESAMSQSLGKSTDIFTTCPHNKRPLVAGYTLPQADFSTYDPSATQTKALHPSRSSTNHGRDRSRPTPSSESLWTEHRRRDSTDSIWSSHSGSSGASPPPMRTRPPSNPLQFQPLPHSQMSPALPISASGPRSGSQLPPGPLPNEYQSPFGVLIADADSHFSQYDTQGLMRTGSQSSFQINFEDGRNALTSARYECTYCGKRFTRPSSLRVSC